LAFIDCKKAFDKVNRNKLIEILTEGYITNQLITAIYEIYKHNLIAVRLQAEISEWKTINCGVRQGCSLSPTTIHNIYEKIIQEWKVTRHGNIPINRNVNIDTTLFEDHQVLLAKFKDDLQYLLHNLNKKSIRIFHGDKRGEN
jgi:TusA-related sulfurtransferase